MRAKFINEAFKDDQSDPIKDMGIGIPEYNEMNIDRDATPEDVMYQVTPIAEAYDVHVTQYNSQDDNYIYYFSKREITQKDIERHMKHDESSPDDIFCVVFDWQEKVDDMITQLQAALENFDVYITEDRILEETGGFRIFYMSNKYAPTNKQLEYMSDNSAAKEFS